MTRAGAPQRGAREWIGVVLAAVLINLVFLAALPYRWRRSQSVDYPLHYASVAHNLLAGEGLRNSEGAPAITYPPGYAFILAGVFAVSRGTGISEMNAVRGFNVVALAATSLLVYAVANMLFGIRTARLSALCWMTYPLPLWLTKQPNTELAFLVAFFGMTYLVLRIFLREGPGTGLAFAAGALVGTASLIRPAAIALSFPVALALFRGSRRRPAKARWRLCALLFLGNLLMVAPWEIWAFRQVGEVIPLSTAGGTSILDGVTLDITAEESNRVVRIPEDVRALIRACVQREAELKTPGTIGRFLGRTLLDEPGTVMKLVAIKAIRSWYATDSQRFEPTVAMIQAPYLLLAGAGAFAAWRRGEIGRKYIGFTAWILSYFWGMTILVLSIARYMIPPMGLLIVFCGFSLSSVLDRFNLDSRGAAGR